MRERTVRIGESALLLGYAMSRLDRRMLGVLGCRTWDEGFEKVAASLGEKPKSIKALRDEFDPFFPNTRRGWADRPVRRPLGLLLGELAEVSDEALLALVGDALSGGRTATEAVAEAVQPSPNGLAAVAERLWTGAGAERFFLENSRTVVGLAGDDLRDCRLNACGYDFGGPGRTVFEVKGMAGLRGSLLFTDREWQVAGDLRSDFHLVVVGSVFESPQAVVVPDPWSRLDVRTVTERRTVANWQASFAVSE